MQKRKTKAYKFTLSIWRHDTFRGHGSFRPPAVTNVLKLGCSFITDVPPTTADIVVAISLTTRQKEKITVSDCKGPVQISPGLSHTAVHHAVSPGSRSVAHWLLQVCSCSLLVHAVTLPSAFLKISTKLELSGHQDQVHQQIWDSSFYL